MNKTFLAIIPARGGSKRLPRKNTLPLLDKPLIGWSIEAALSSKNINRVVVSSDCADTLTVSKQYGAETLKRPDALASDTATMMDVLNHALTHYSDYEYTVLLQPTSPLRNAQHIDSAINLLFEKKADAIISVCDVDHHPWWCNTIPENGDISSFIKKDIQNRRSQDLPVYYRLNGAIYICKTQRLIQEQSLMLKDNIYAYKMPRHFSVDIDVENDFLYAQFLLKNMTF